MHLWLPREYSVLGCNVVISCCENDQMMRKQYFSYKFKLLIIIVLRKDFQSRKLRYTDPCKDTYINWICQFIRERKSLPSCNIHPRFIVAHKRTLIWCLALANCIATARWSAVAKHQMFIYLRGTTTRDPYTKTYFLYNESDNYAFP